MFLFEASILKAAYVKIEQLIFPLLYNVASQTLHLKQNLQIGLTSHLGDSGIKNKPISSSTHGMAPGNFR